jgi:hypothetical protein
MFNYSEEEILSDVKKYVCSTYRQHYKSKSVQLIDLFASEDMIIDYLKTSIMRYVLRYGKKADENKNPYNVKDLFKAIHCIILLIHFTRKPFTSPELLLENNQNENF